MIPLPIGIDFVYWANLMAEYFAEYAISYASPDTDWKRWAAEFIAVPNLEVQGLPSPVDFSNWLDWATRLVEMLV